MDCEYCNGDMPCDLHGELATRREWKHSEDYRGQRVNLKLTEAMPAGTVIAVWISPKRRTLVFNMPHGGVHGEVE